jgi:hypothetical protein
MRNTTHLEIGRFAPVLSSTLALLLAACATNHSIAPVAEPGTRVIQIVPRDPYPEARAPDHFYFDPRTSAIELSK